MWDRGQITDFRIGDEVLVHLPSSPEEPLAFPAVVVSWDEIEVDADGMPINVPGRQSADRVTMVPVKWTGYGWYDLPDKADVTLVKRARTFQRPNLAGGSGDERPVVLILIPGGDFTHILPLGDAPYRPEVSLAEHFSKSVYVRALGTPHLVTLDPATKWVLPEDVRTGAFQELGDDVRGALGLNLSAWEAVGGAAHFRQQALRDLNHPASCALDALIYGPVLVAYRLTTPRPNRTARAEVYAVPSRQAWPIGDKRHALLAIRYMEARFGNPMDYPQIIDAIRKRWGDDPEVMSELRTLRRGAAAYRETLDETGSRTAAKQAGRTARERARALRTRGVD